MNGKKLICTAALLAAALVTVSGCSKVKKMESKSAAVTYSENVYPMSCSDSLSVWSATLGGGEDLNEAPIGKQWQKETGVNVEFIQPMQGSSEAFNVLIASGDLPDILITNLQNEPGGVMRFARDKIIQPIDEQLSDYAPNMKKYIDENKDVEKIIKCDDGHIYSFLFAREKGMPTTSAGPVVRKDMLDKAGLTVPETIDEWHTALAAFKAQGAAAPLSYDLLYWEGSYGPFFGAYGTKPNCYGKDGKVVNGYLEPEMKEARKTMNQWYSEGRLDKNSVKIADMDANIMNSATGGSCMWAGSGLGKYMNAMAGKDPNFDLVPAPFPVLNKGDKSLFGSGDFSFNPNNNGFITTSCGNVELAMRFLDYGYTDAGHMLFNFGVEGESYELKDGEPVYTDVIMKNPEGLSISDAMNKYIFGNNSAPFIQDARYLEQYYQLKSQQDAMKVWSESSDALKSKIPYLTFTDEESSKLNTIVNNIQTTTDEMIFKFIMGIEPLENYDSFISTLEGFGIRDAVDIYNKALERYNAK